ncbi:MAG: hypothetical protein Q9219_000430 [cf. Caloplaca sp. 3 TL-2023]
MNSPISSLTDLSSDLSSIGSLSPPPPPPQPFDYPSPQSSQDRNLSDSGSQHAYHKRPRESDEHTSVRKRRKAEPKPRKTDYLDLQAQHGNFSSDQQPQLDTLLKVLRKRKKIVVIAGAGISVSAGIPDFRSASGLFASLKQEHNLKASGKHLFDASVYQTDSSTTSFHTMVRGLSKLASNAKPTAFHHLLATLGSQGRLMRLYTQNVDGIDTSLTPLATSVPLASKGPWPRTIQLHGGLEKMVCSKCSHLSDFEPALFEGPSPPPCRQCVEADKVRTAHAGKRSHGIGRLRPRIVLYNEHNPDDEAIGTVVSSDLRGRPDAVIVVGTSMKIPGVRRIVREMCGVVRARRDGLAVWVNRDPPPIGKEFEDCWDLVVKGSSDDVANFANMRHWDDDGIDVKCCTDSEAERAMREQKIRVLIESPERDAAASIPTPVPSPGPKFQQQQQTKLNFSNLCHVEIPGRKSEPLDHSRSVAQKATARSHPSKKPTKIKRAKAKISDLASNAKINMAYKVTKPRTAISEDIKKKTVSSTFNEDEPREVMAPISSQSARDNVLRSSSCEISKSSDLKFQVCITPADLELRGPVKVVLASAINKSEEIESVAVSTQVRKDPGIISPTGRLPTGMASLLH